MTGNQSELTRWGWGPWFEGRLALMGLPVESVARVAAVDREQLLLVDGAGLFRGKLSGSFRHRARAAEELPCVGDWVCVERPPGDGPGLVQAVLERRTFLRRKGAGAAVEAQAIAANVDCAIVVQSCHFDFNLRRLERYLVMAAEGGAQPCVLLTKTDLVDPETLAGQVARIRAAGVTAPVLTLSNVTREGIDALRGMLSPGKTYCFVGSSGVGKSTIINGLVGRDALGTGDVSGTGEGRHTTVRRELILLPNGALVVDNPGMRELGVLGAEEGIGGGFLDIDALASRCRYRDCAHAGEPGCAVVEALETGAVDRGHYENFLKLKKESGFHAMTYAEKRRKDRDFGRFVKSVKKGLDRD